MALGASVTCRHLVWVADYRERFDEISEKGAVRGIGSCCVLLYGVLVNCGTHIDSLSLQTFSNCYSNVSNAVYPISVDRVLVCLR